MAKYDQDKEVNPLHEKVKKDLSDRTSGKMSDQEFSFDLKEQEELILNTIMNSYTEIFNLALFYLSDDTILQRNWYFLGKDSLRNRINSFIGCKFGIYRKYQDWFIKKNPWISKLNDLFHEGNVNRSIIDIVISGAVNDADRLITQFRKNFGPSWCTLTNVQKHEKLKEHYQTKIKSINDEKISLSIGDLKNPVWVNFDERKINIPCVMFPIIFDLTSVDVQVDQKSPFIVLTRYRHYDDIVPGEDGEADFVPTTWTVKFISMN